MKNRLNPWRAAPTPIGTVQGQRGLSLVELMIALLLGLVIVAALTELFVDVSRTNREMAKTSSQIENARFAMQFLQNDIQHAGFWGGFVPEFDNLVLFNAPTDVPTLVPDPCLAITTPWSAAYIDAMLGIPIQAYHNVAPGSCGGVLTNRLANTDVLVVRHANTCVPGDANCEADVGGAVYIQVSNCETEIDDGFPYALGTSGFIRYERDCAGASGSPPTFTSGTVAAKRKLIQNIYYIRDFAVNAGDGIPTLVRSRLDLSAGTVAHQPAEPLVMGIERFRVELGIDNVSDSGAAVDDAAYAAAVDWADPDNWVSPQNRGDGIPDGAFVHCDATCTVADLRNVVAVKLYVLARADQPTPGYVNTKSYTTMGGLSVPAFNDGFKRHAFSTSVRLYNVAGRRETP